MPLSILKHLGLITPGIIFLFYATLCGWITGYWTIPFELDVQELLWSLLVIVPGGIYYKTPLRDMANRRFFDEISENIRVQLMQIANLPDDPNRYTWKRVRGIFFMLIDSDKSLKTKASMAYFNGYIWTTLADVRALSIAFMIFAVAVSAVEPRKGLTLLCLFLSFVLVSLLGSFAVTRRHKEIGNQQLEIIEHEYRDTLRERLQRID